MAVIEEEHEDGDEAAGDVEKIAGGDEAAFAFLGGAMLQERIERNDVEAGGGADGDQADDHFDFVGCDDGHGGCGDDQEREADGDEAQL